MQSRSLSLALYPINAYCRWIAGKISEILGNEDDVVTELCFNLLEGARFVSNIGLHSIPYIADYSRIA